MEGLLDWVLRDILTRAGGIDRCVSEFIRVTGTLLPDRAFRRVMPELDHGGLTPAGVPVRAQLMGSDAVCLAENAAAVAALGAAGVDLNFGCPAKVVNRHGGGAALLTDPELLLRLVETVRRALPAEVPLSAKMRLGYYDDALAVECAQAIEAGGATELVVHARTKAEAYRPPAHWERVGDIRAAVRLRVIANGDVFSPADAQRCREISGCDDLMLGRGIVTDPGLALAIAMPGHRGLDWAALQPLLAGFWLCAGELTGRNQRAGRLKQWLNFLRRRYPEAEALYLATRAIGDEATLEALLLGAASSAFTRIAPFASTPPLASRSRPKLLQTRPWPTC